MEIKIKDNKGKNLEFKNIKEFSLFLNRDTDSVRSSIKKFSAQGVYDREQEKLKSLIEYKGELKTIGYIARMKNVDYTAFKKRLDKGMSFEESLNSFNRI